MENKGRLKQWLGLIAAQRLEDEADRQHRAIGAEDRAIQKRLYGEEPPQEEEEMRQTVLGDIVTHPTPVVVQQSKSGLGPLAAALLGAAIPAAGAVGYLVANAPNSTPAPAPQIQPVEQVSETVNLGLGRIEDYFGKQESGVRDQGPGNSNSPF